MPNKPGNALHIGWSSTSITPERPVMLAGQFYVRVSKGVADPITATALALSSGSDQAVLVSCDLVGIGSEVLDRVRDKVQPRAEGLDVRSIIVNATHVHTGPVYAEGWYPQQPPPVMTPAEGAEFLSERIAKAVVEAWDSRKPGSVSRAFGHAVVGHNRRAWYADGHAEMYGRTDRDDFLCIEGYEDHSVDMLFFWDSRRALSGIALNVACPAQVSEHADRVTADYWHETRRELRRRFGRGLSVLPLCGAAGDQSPHFLLYGAQEEQMRALRRTSERGEIAHKISEAVARAHLTARKNVEKNAVLRHVVEDISLAPRRITEGEVRKARADLTTLQALLPGEGQRESRAQVIRAQSVIDRFERQDTQKPFGMELHVLRLGDVALATNPFELYQDFGLRIRARSKAAQTFVVQLACGYSGYLPTARALAAGSYGADPASNKVGPEGGQELVEQTLRAIGQLWEP